MSAACAKRPARTRKAKRSTVYCEDNLVTTGRIEDGRVDLTVTSPPYDALRKYNGFAWDVNRLAAELYRITKPGGICVWVVADQCKNHRLSLTSFRHAIAFEQAGWGVFQVIIYERGNMGAPRNRRYQDSHEYMFIFSKGRPATVNLLMDRPNAIPGQTKNRPKTRRTDGTMRINRAYKVGEFGKRWSVWRYCNSCYSGTSDLVAYNHPATFPEALASDHIKSWSNPRDLVYDPFGGAGTTAKMAALLDRDWIASELSPEYCTGIISPRLQAHNIKHRVEVRSGELPFRDGAN